MKPVIIHNQARAEIDKAIAFYEDEKAGLGLDMQIVVEQAITTIQQNPQLGARYKTTECRRYIVRRFPYVIFYLELSDAIWIVAIAHGKRRPDYWKKRQIALGTE